MSRYLRRCAAAAVVVLVASGCRAAEQPALEDRPEAARGGTLRVGLEADVDAAFDPQKEYSSVPWGFFHCCLLRTLITTPTVPSEEGGDELQPDLAAELPEISEDGRTYTFTIRDGVLFGPPVNREIVADDVITALERTADPEASAGGYSFYYEVIEGFGDFADGEAESISGIRAVDEKTVEITLARPTYDFAFRMSLPAAAPLPAEAVEGHEKDYGRFLVSSGPYMFEGSEELDFTAPIEEQEPVGGYDPSRSIVLVRNPEWDADMDPIRPAFVNRIEVECCISASDQQAQIDAGELDISLDYIPPAEAVQRYQTNPDLEDRVRVNSAYGFNYLSINILEPPFDDINVRRAVNLVLDKASLIRIAGGEEVFGSPFGHIIDDSLLGGMLADYDPYGTPDQTGDVEAAKEAMRESRYDTDGDGVCDAPECEDVVVVNDEADPYPALARVIRQNFEEIGISLDIGQFEFGTFIERCEHPAEHVAMCLALGWGADYADATTFAEPLFGSGSIAPESCCNTSLVGMPEELAEEYGYDVTDVPSVDDKIEECDALPLGEDRLRCWAELDQTLMEDIVPFVPYAASNDAYILGERIVHYKYDQFASVPALDQISLAGGGA